MTISALPRRDFAVLFTVLLTVAAGNTALQSVLPSIARAIHIPDLLVAVIFSFSALLWTFSAPYWARASDVQGRKRLLQVGVAGFGVSMLGCAAAILAGLQGWLAPIATFVLFAGLRSLFGLFGSASNPAAQAYVAARSSPAERTSALAMLTSAFGLGTILGPGIAPYMQVAPLGLSGPAWCCGGCCRMITPPLTCRTGTTAHRRRCRPSWAVQPAPAPSRPTSGASRG